MAQLRRLPLESACTKPVRTSPEFHASGDWQKALSVLDSSLSSSLEVDGCTCVGILTACSKGLSWPAAFQLLSNLRLTRLRMNFFICGAAIAACDRTGHWELAISTLSKLEFATLRANTVIGNSLISACGRCCYWEHALQSLVAIGRRNLQPDAVTCTAIVSALDKGLCRRAALSLLATLQHRSARPNCVAHGAALSVMSDEACWTDALALLNLVLSDSVEATVRQPTIVLRACDQARQWCVACQVLATAQGKHLEPDRVAYNTLSAAFASDFEWERAGQILSAMEEQWTAPGIDAHSTTMKAFEAVNYWEGAEGLLCDARRQQLKSDRVTFGGLMRAVAQEPGWTPIGLSQKASWTRSGLCLQRMLREKVDPNVVVFNTAIYGCRRTMGWTTGLAHLELLRRRHCEPDSITRNSLINHFEISARHSLMSSCIEPGALPREAQGHGYVQRDMCGWTLCLQLLMQQPPLRVENDIVVMQTAARVCGQCRNWEAAVALLTSVEQSGAVDPDGLIFNAVAWACQISGVRWQEVAIQRPRKEAAVLEFVQQHAARGDVAATLSAMERFARERRWLKLAGGAKRRVIEGCVMPGDRVLELGTYIGYSALMIAQRLRGLGGGGHVVSCDFDATVHQYARTGIAWAGTAAQELELKLGWACDLCSNGRIGPVDVLVLDHRGSKYHEDLSLLETALAVGARVIADNVLNPGAPLLLHYLSWASLHRRHEVVIQEMHEFNEPDLQDWVIVTSVRSSHPLAPAAPSAPRELQCCAAKIDRTCWLSQGKAQVDWIAQQSQLETTMRRWRQSFGF